MNHLVVFAGLFSMTLADFVTVTPPPWQGPLADHILGIPPRDTPEVQAAKAALNTAYSQVLSVVPVLPPEQRYIPGPVQHQPHIQPHVQAVILPHWQATVEPIQPKAVFIPAEQVPRSSLGEVPEVQAAREAHLKAYREVASRLPKLVETTSGYQHVPTPIPGLFQVIQDTPEVARAKAEHAAAVAATLG